MLEVDVDPVKSAGSSDHGNIRGAHLVDPMNNSSSPALSFRFV
jgi:hypothetical protein